MPRSRKRGRIEEERIDDDLPGLLFKEKEEMQNSTGVIWIFYGDDRQDRIESGVAWIGEELDNKLTCRASFSPPIIETAEMIKLQNSKLINSYNINRHYI